MDSRLFDRLRCPRGFWPSAEPADSKESCPRWPIASICPDPPVAGRISSRRRGPPPRPRPPARAGRLVEVFDGRGTGLRAEVRAVVGRPGRAGGHGRPDPRSGAAAVADPGGGGPEGGAVRLAGREGDRAGRRSPRPLITRRSAVDPRPGKLERLRRAVVEASKQCGRNRLMEIGRPTTLEEVLEPRDCPGPAAWSPIPADCRRALAREPPGARMRPWRSGRRGGFTEARSKRARAAGWRVVASGATILRIETAALAASALALGDRFLATGRPSDRRRGDDAWLDGRSR